MFLTQLIKFHPLESHPSHTPQKSWYRQLMGILSELGLMGILGMVGILSELGFMGLLGVLGWNMIFFLKRL